MVMLLFLMRKCDSRFGFNHIESVRFLDLVCVFFSASCSARAPWKINFCLKNKTLEANALIIPYPILKNNSFFPHTKELGR